MDHPTDWSKYLLDQEAWQTLYSDRVVASGPGAERTSCTWHTYFTEHAEVASLRVSASRTVSAHAGSGTATLRHEGSAIVYSALRRLHIGALWYRYRNLTPICTELWIPCTSVINDHHGIWKLGTWAHGAFDISFFKFLVRLKCAVVTAHNSESFSAKPLTYAFKAVDVASLVLTSRHWQNYCRVIPIWYDTYYTPRWAQITNPLRLQARSRYFSRYAYMPLSGLSHMSLQTIGLDTIGHWDHLTPCYWWL